MHDIVSLWRSANSRICDLWYKMDAAAVQVIRYGGSVGVNDKNRLGEIETYGGKLTENCVQAIARDCLSQAIEHLESAGLRVVFHIHDEVVIDCPPETATLADVVQIMTKPIPWATGLPLGADGWVGKFFKKD